MVSVCNDARVYNSQPGERERGIEEKAVANFP
jgi:hypothetical protein